MINLSDPWIIVLGIGVGLLIIIVALVCARAVAQYGGDI
jgi:hypothetical protein